MLLVIGFMGCRWHDPYFYIIINQTMVSRLLGCSAQSASENLRFVHIEIDKYSKQKKKSHPIRCDQI